MIEIGSVSATSGMMATGSPVNTSQRIQGENVERIETKPQEKFGIEQAAFSEQKENMHQFSKDSLTRMMEESNTLLKTINTDIRFRWHDKAQELMVEIYDQRDERVLKTYPSKEFLDTMAKIRDFIGALLDVKV